jgi:transposase InsO family protein
VRPADVPGAAGIPPVGAHRDRIIPRAPGPREGERDGGDAGEDAQVLDPEPLAEETHNAEESRVPGGEHYDRLLRFFDSAQRSRKISLQHGSALRSYAELLEMATSTVSAVLKRIGLGRLSRLASPEPARRYEKQRPGELIHIDVKKLGRIGPHGAGHRMLGRGHSRRRRTRTDAAGVSRNQTGWERVHVAVDDATRLAYVEVLADEKATTAIGFLKRALAFYRSHGISVERLMTDNGSAYVSVAHAVACRALGIRHLRTRPYRPQTNGKAERLIRTLLSEWAYAALYGSSAERTAALAGWLERYNFRRRHGALGHRPPIERLRELRGNNVVGNYS